MVRNVPSTPKNPSERNARQYAVAKAAQERANAVRRYQTMTRTRLVGIN